jgi:protein-tyrosine phosphatase
MVFLIKGKMSRKRSASAEFHARCSYVDIHCHCLPGVDDGPATKSEALALCKALVEDSIKTAIATPHQLGRFEGKNASSKVRQAVLMLNEELRANSIDLTVVPGGDVRVDERICQLLATDEVLTLADSGKYIMLELPHEILIDIDSLLVELSCVGVRAILSHPERHRLLVTEPGMLLKWLQRGALVQITAGSLVGQFGDVVMESAWAYLRRGMVAVVATDAHDLGGRRPSLKAAFERICVELGEGIARRVCVENPLRVLKGQDIASFNFASAHKYNETVTASF